jgi:alkylation response protein AidB-like acyl-CoA dehydrogenase
MQFRFTGEQVELHDAVNNLLSVRCTPAAVRAAWSAPAGSLDRSTWQALADMGAFDILVPVADGGLGLDWCSLVLVLEASGRVALPYPFVETAAVAAPLLGAPSARPGAPMISASLGGTPAVCGDDADLILVDHGDSLLMVPRAGILGHPLESVDRTRRLLRVDSVDKSQVRVVAEGPAAVEAALDSAALGTAAQLLGLAQTMLDMTVAYVRERHQFGVPIASFQAVKHRLADALMELSFARPVVYRAAWSMAVTDAGASGHVAMAKAMASDAAELIGRDALQCHGAMGYSDDYDLHLYLKRTWALARAFGSSAWHRQRVGSALGLTSARSRRAPHTTPD